MKQVYNKISPKYFSSPTYAVKVNYLNVIPNNITEAAKWFSSTCTKAGSQISMNMPVSSVWYDGVSGGYAKNIKLSNGGTVDEFFVGRGTSSSTPSKYFCLNNNRIYWPVENTNVSVRIQMDINNPCIISLSRLFHVNGLRITYFENDPNNTKQGLVIIDEKEIQTYPNYTSLVTYLHDVISTLPKMEVTAYIVLGVNSGSFSWEQISDEDKKIATDKGWTLAL